MVMYKIDTPHLYKRDGVYYLVRRVPIDIRSYYSSNRISISLKTKSLATANRAMKSINQRLDDFWLGLRHTYPYAWDIPPMVDMYI